MKQQQELLTITSTGGNLQAVLHILENNDYSSIGIVCHPHPLYQGSMQNKVVTTIAKAMLAMNIPTIRFNFRGVGESEGSFDHGIGETEDCLAIIDWANSRWPQAKIWLAGFSFGSFIAIKVANIRKVFQLITVAPPVHYPEFVDFAGACPCLVIQGEQDEIVPANLVYDWFASLKAKKSLIKLLDSSHFFHGKLIELSANIKTHFGF